MAYAGICHKSKLLDSTLQLALTVISEATDRNINSIKSELTQQVKRTRREDKEPSWWTRVLEKHYRVYQIRNVCKWSVSRKITLRLKLARTKNLVLFDLTLRRKQFATELKHIRNEVIKTSLKGVDLEKQNKYIKSVLAATQDNWKDIPVFII